MSLIETKEVKFYSSVDDFPKVGNELCVADGVLYAVSGGISGEIGGGSGVSSNLLGRFGGEIISNPSGRVIGDYQVVGAGSVGSIVTDVFGATDMTNTLRVNINRGSATATDVNILHAITPMLVKSGRVGLWVYVEDYTKLASITPKISLNGTAYAEGFFQSYTFADADKAYNGWHFIGFDANATGGIGADYTGVYTTGNWATQTLQNVKITINQNSADPCNIYIGKWLADWNRKAKLMIIADDGYASWFSRAVPLLNSLNLKSAASIIAAQIGLNSTWATLSQIRNSYDKGHDLVTHGATALSSLADAAAIRADISLNRDFLKNNGFTRSLDYYVYPNGVYQLSAGDATIKNILISEGFKAARGTTNPRQYRTPDRPADAKWLMPVLGVSGATAPSAITGYIDKLITYGGVGSLMYHDIVLSGGTTATTRNLSDFKDEMVYLAQKQDAGLIDVITPSEFIYAEGL